MNAEPWGSDRLDIKVTLTRFLKEGDLKVRACAGGGRDEALKPKVCMYSLQPMT